MAHDEDFDPSNYRRYGLINKIFHHGIRDAEFDSVSTDRADINDQQVHPDQTPVHSYAADRPETQIGDMSEMRLAPLVSGSRILANSWSLTGGDATYSVGGSWTEPRAPITWISMDQPPNLTPVLKLWTHYQSDTNGEETQVRVNRAGNVGILKNRTFDTDSEDWHLSETYLNEHYGGLASRKSMKEGNFTIETTSTGTGTGTLYGDSMLILEWEVV